MKLIFLNTFRFLLFTILTFGCSQSTSWTEVHGGENVGSTLSSIYFFDSQNGFVSTTFDLFKTNDSGQTLEQVDKLPDMTFDSIYFDSHGNGWITGTENGVPKILRTVDRGETWNPVILESDPIGEFSNVGFTRFYDVCFGDNDRGWIAGDKGVVGVTLDNNRLVASNSFYLPFAIFSVTCSGTMSFAAGKQGTILSYNGQWTKETKGSDITFTRIKKVAGNIWVVGGNSTKGSVFTKSVVSRIWEDRTPPNSRIFFDITPVNDQIYLAGSAGSLFGTRDNGRSWNTLSLSTAIDLSRIFCTDSVCWIIGDRLTIFRSHQ